MKVLAHRGLWGGTIESNSLNAIRTALENGFGFESDIRDYQEKLVISHNIADSKSFDAETVFKWLNEFDDKYIFAINIKADGLKELIVEYLNKYNITSYFLFDMSVPQMVEFREIGLRFFTRQSEVESFPVMYEDAAGVWIDGFWSVDWITKELIENHIKNGKEVCLVSPDLHGQKNYVDFWNKLKDYNFMSDQIMICTDHPKEAKEFFL